VRKASAGVRNPCLSPLFVNADKFGLNLLAFGFPFFVIFVFHVGPKGFAQGRHFFGQRVSDSYAFLPLGFLAFARFFVSGLSEGLGSAKQRHIRHNILMSI